MKKNIGYALTGSFCTFSKSLRQIEILANHDYNVIPIMSENAYAYDTRFGTAEKFVKTLETITGNAVLHTITDVEPIGPKRMLDLLIISPCTGNTLGKLASGIYDTAVTLSAKSHLRNQRPVLIGVSTNDALSGSAKNIGLLLNSRYFYFLPMSQDDTENKPRSVVANFERTLEATELALEGKQLQPIFEAAK